MSNSLLHHTIKDNKMQHLVSLFNYNNNFKYIDCDIYLLSRLCHSRCVNVRICMFMYMAENLECRWDSREFETKPASGFSSFSALPVKGYFVGNCCEWVWQKCDKNFYHIIHIGYKPLKITGGSAGTRTQGHLIKSPFNPVCRDYHLLSWITMEWDIPTLKTHLPLSPLTTELHWDWRLLDTYVDTCPPFRRPTSF